MAFLAVRKMREHRREPGATAAAGLPPDPDQLYP
jgi:hypothetical protein